MDKNGSNLDLLDFLTTYVPSKASALYYPLKGLGINLAVDLAFRSRSQLEEVISSENIPLIESGMRKYSKSHPPISLREEKPIENSKIEIKQGSDDEGRYVQVGVEKIYEKYNGRVGVTVDTLEQIYTKHFEGKKAKIIAEELDLSQTTVDSYLIQAGLRQKTSREGNHNHKLKIKKFIPKS